MKWIYDLSYDQLYAELITKGLKPFTAGQIFQWLYAKNIQDIQLWSNISKSNREHLSKFYDTSLNDVIDVTGDEEGTGKMLIKLKDGHKVECVLIKEKDHYTFCLSSQVGCSLGCKFCATGTMGFTRNLSSGEILSQLLLLKKRIPDYTGKLNLVFMGMGEPLLNYENLKHALNIITAEKGTSISPRNITVSTAGILKKLKALEHDFPRIKVSFSLNAPGVEQRKEVMPVSNTQPLPEIMEYLRNHQRKHRITFEYVLLKGVNDSLKDAGKLAALLRGFPCKINLIPYNENKGLPFKTPDTKTVDNFSEFLHKNGYTVVVRWSKGRGIGSACGQLAAGMSGIGNLGNMK
jgi:23S rRNA (adenine2503-C2)-methyltransferase